MPLPSLRRPRAPPLPSEDSLQLISAIRPLLTTPAFHSRRLLGVARRHVEVRANFLLIQRRPHAKLTPPNLLAVLPLPLHQTVHVTNHTTVQFATTKLIFSTRTATTAFLSLLPHQLPAHPPAALSSAHLETLPLLGRGATAAVRQLSQRTAVKLLPKSHAFESPQTLRQVVAERRAFSTLRSVPFTLRLHAACQTPRYLCLVTELPFFGDLHSVMQELPDKCFPPAVAKLLFTDMVVALEGVHSAGLLYRDFKLANVLLTACGHIRLADFGLVKEVAVSHTDASSVSSRESGDDSQARLVGTTCSFVGTRRYMSPEVCGKVGARRTYGAPADVWALGVTLFVLLTARYPFTAPPSGSGLLDPTSLFLAIQNDDVPVPENLGKSVGDLLRAMLTRDPLERIDLFALKHCAWLRDVDWPSVRTDGISGRGHEEVVDFLDKAGVRGVVERTEEESRLFSGKSDFSSLTGEKLGKGLVNLDQCHLLGFEYMD